MQDFEEIRFYNEKEVQESLQHYIKHPMMKALLHFTFPEKTSEEIKDIVLSCKSIRDFQTKIIYHSVGKIIEKSTDGVTDSGFDKLKPGESYFFLSTHRDIILDTSLLNYTLYNHNLVMTASAIGDNLVQKTFLMALSKLNRNFLVRRKLSPREMLKSSIELSTFIRKMLLEDKRSVWMAQREGRTKDGSDYTQQGVLKMIGMGKDDLSLTDYFGKLKIVPISISYEFDPTDVLKMPEILSKRMKEKYVKAPDEDFKSIIQTLPFPYEKITPENRYIKGNENPPEVKIKFFKDLIDVKNITCYSNEGNIWRKSDIKFINESELEILLKEKFKSERGRINCSLWAEKNRWRWLGIQYVIAEY